MQHSEKPRIELNVARSALSKMCSAANLMEMEFSWKQFLHHLERVWNKAEDHYRKSPKWHSWNGKYAKLRRSDPLLSYLINARNVDEHSISDITQFESGFVGINPPPGSDTLVINELSFDKNGQIFLNTSSGATITFSPSKIRLLPVTNHGRTYSPPTEHMGEQIKESDLIAVATAAVAFYDEFLIAAENYFVTPVPSGKQAANAKSSILEK